MAGPDFQKNKGVHREFVTPKGTKLPIMDLRGKDYMAVAVRLVWFREERPDWSIETEYLEQDNTHAVAVAFIKNQNGVTIATGHKHEDKAGFGDFREKAETGAIGRALAHCGYGTQFAPELDEGDRIVDSPQTPKQSISLPTLISDAQRKRLFAIASNHGWSDGDVKALVLKITGQDSTKNIPWVKYDLIWKFIEANPRPREPGDDLGPQTELE